jgi:hypothetical protein
LINIPSNYISSIPIIINNFGEPDDKNGLPNINLNSQNPSSNCRRAPTTLHLANERDALEATERGDPEPPSKIGSYLQQGSEQTFPYRSDLFSSYEPPSSFASPAVNIFPMLRFLSSSPLKNARACAPRIEYPALEGHQTRQEMGGLSPQQTAPPFALY